MGSRRTDTPQRRSYSAEYAFEGGNNMEGNIRIRIYETHDGMTASCSGAGPNVNGFL